MTIHRAMTWVIVIKFQANKQCFTIILTNIFVIIAEVEQTVRLLIEAGANVNLEDYEDMTPLQWALRYNSLEISKMLLDAGAQVNRQDDCNSTPLHFAARLGDCDFAQRCIDGGVSIDEVESPYGVTALHYATRCNNREMVELLLKTGSDANITDRKGFGPLHWAVNDNRPELIKILLESGKADINLQDHSDTKDYDDNYYYDEEDEDGGDENEQTRFQGASALQVCAV